MSRNGLVLEGTAELVKSIEKLGKLPQKHITAATKKAMSPVLKQAKANAPYDTGALKKGIKLVGERSRQKSKKVYRIVFDRAMNDVFQKKSASGKGGYYPVSQEYGFFARNGRYIPGYRFIADSFEDNLGQIEHTIVADLKAKIDKEIEKAGL